MSDEKQNENYGKIDKSELGFTYAQGKLAGATRSEAAYFPIWVNLNNKSCVVVGGGQVAERRIASLLAANAQVIVVSPEVTPTIAEWIAEGRLDGLKKYYASGDCLGMFLIIAATNSAEVNAQVYCDALEQGQLINRVDSPERSNFIVPAVVRRGKLAIAVSTSGASPALAAQIRQKLEQEYGWEYEIYLDFLAELRWLAQERIVDPVERRTVLKKALQLNLLKAIRDGAFQKERWIELLFSAE
jgi:precorrin-2 dehydrogenase/sirohydrochlorin ferrochelatase